VAVIDVLQCGFAGTLKSMGHPHPHAASHSHDDHSHDSHGHDGHGHDGHSHGGHGHGDAAGRSRAGLTRVVFRVVHGLRPHSHEPGEQVDAALEASAEGMRVLWVSLGTLAATAAVQAVVAALSGSVALLGDTLHNAADALTAVPLGVAFAVGRRPATRRYTYGFGRAEDLAGVAVVVLIAASSALAGWEAMTRLAHPRPVSTLAAVAAAAVAGFAGNELVARYRIRAGRRIGSAALVADGLHARADGFTSLAVLLGAGGAAAGWDRADPVVGLGITVAIAAVLWQAGREVYRRLMDAVDPALVTRAEQVLRETPGVLGTGEVRLRWIGHRLRAECEVIVDPAATVVAAHQVTVSAEHALLHAIPQLSGALVHADPQPREGSDDHAVLAPHRPAQAGSPPASPAPAVLLAGPGCRDRLGGGAGQQRHGLGRERG
jgi:cation diffusion facilitator family transporter